MHISVCTSVWFIKILNNEKYFKKVRDAGVSFSQRIMMRMTANVQSSGSKQCVWNPEVHNSERMSRSHNMLFFSLIILWISWYLFFNNCKLNTSKRFYYNFVFFFKIVLENVKSFSILFLFINVKYVWFMFL